MTKFRGFKLFAGPVIAAALTAPMVGGCSDDGGGLAGGCEADIRATAEAFSASVDALVAASGEMKASLYVACANIATDLGAADAPDPAATDVGDEDLTAACDLAATAIGEAKASVTGSVQLIYVAPKCEVNASAQLSCEADCTVDAECDPGTIEARCTEGELSGTCSGECTGTVSCEGSASVAAECEGTCAAECTGTCEGTCNGTCEGTCSAENTDGECAGTCEGTCTGSCSAKCTGTCSGSCELAADAEVECSGSASCKGECSVEMTAPKCEAELEPPSCEMDADCQAGCKGNAQFEATCTKPSVSVVAQGNAELTATLEANMPAVFQVAAQAELMVEAAADVAGRTGDVIAAVGGSLKCAASYGADFTAKLQGAVEAQASVNVSVSASASVSGEASSG
jgi:hypothetical protein